MMDSPKWALVVEAHAKILVQSCKSEEFEAIRAQWGFHLSGDGTNDASSLEDAIRYLGALAEHRGSMSKLSAKMIMRMQMNRLGLTGTI